MTKKAIVLAIAAACIGSAVPAFAAGYDNDRNDRYEQRDHRYDQGRNYSARDQRYEQRQDRREYRRDMRDDRRDARHYSVSQRYDLYRGGRLPSAYHGDRYVVSDWHRYRLSAPSRGHHWVRAGNDYVMVALATGIIAQVLLNN